MIWIVANISVNADAMMVTVNLVQGIHKDSNTAHVAIILLSHLLAVKEEHVLIQFQYAITLATNFYLVVFTSAKKHATLGHVSLVKNKFNKNVDVVRIGDKFLAI